MALLVNLYQSLAMKRLQANENGLSDAVRGLIMVSPFLKKTRFTPKAHRHRKKGLNIQQILSTNASRH